MKFVLAILFVVLNSFSAAAFADDFSLLLEDLAILASDSTATTTCSVPPGCSCSGASCSKAAQGNTSVAKCKDSAGNLTKVCIGQTGEVSACGCGNTREEALRELANSVTEE